MGFLRNVIDWSQKRMRENRSISEIKRDVERLELRDREIKAEVRLGSSEELARLAVEDEKRRTRHSGPPTAQQIIERIKQLDAEEQESLKHVTDKRTIRQIRQVYDAKRQAAKLGEF